MVMSAETLATTSQNSEYFCFSPSKQNDIYNWFLLQILSYFSFRETSRHNHRYPFKFWSKQILGIILSNFKYFN